MMAKGDKNNPMAAMMGQMGMGFSSAKLGERIAILTSNQGSSPRPKTRPGS